MSDSERYLQPPPPYELSLEYDQAFDSDVSKCDPFRDEDRDSKRPTAFSNKYPTNPVLHTFSTVPKRSAGSPANRNSRVQRPLPPSPADTPSRSQGSKLEPVAEIKSFTAQNDLEREPHSPVPPPFSAIGPSPNVASYAQSVSHPSTAPHPSPFHHPPQLSHDTPPQNRDDRWRASTYSPTVSETSFRRLSNKPSLSPWPQDDNFRTRLPFDPFVAYSGSQAYPPTTLPVQREVATSLYSSAVSPHLCLDFPTTPGSPQYLPQRSAVQSAEPLRFDEADVRHTRPHSTQSLPPTSLYLPRMRARSVYGYEQRWAISESDITRDVYLS